MIVYQSDKAGFLADVLTNNISDIMEIPVIMST